MPIPVPKGESQDDLDMGACIRHLRRKNPEMDAKQRIAVCFSVWRKAHGKKARK